VTKANKLHFSVFDSIKITGVVLKSVNYRKLCPGGVVQQLFGRHYISAEPSKQKVLLKNV